MRIVKNSNRRFRFWLHLAGAYISRYKYPFFITVFTLIISSYFLIRLWPKITRADIVTIGYVGNYTIDTIPAEILSLATKSLITVDAKGTPQPLLASHWTVSDDGKVYTVFLRDDLKWHNDEVVDAKDITIAIKNVSITALNNKTIQFSLPNPISSFPTALDKPVFKTKSFYGVGDFRISGIDTSGDTIQKIKLTPKTKGFPRVEINFYSSQTQLLNAIKIGDVRYASVANGKVFENFPNLSVSKRASDDEIVTIFFNTSDQLLGSVDLREALSYAINKSSFDGESATGPIAPSSWAYNPEVKRYEYNTGKAKELLSKSQVKNPKIVLSVVGGYEDVAQSVARDWRDLGVDVEIKYEKSIPTNYQALIAVDKIPADPDQYALWHSTQTKTNLTKLNDPKIDKILEDARITQDEDARKKLYADFQRFLMEDAPVALLYRPYKYLVTYKNVQPLVSKLPSLQLE
ncbi:MAG TPA: ABC transporter substrate-binding protein [Candidatus Saccharimonadales bacterium]|nr:ABC transporter substrate-binding protein [Candidatus Saccharimonadales bacterium]